MNEKEEHFSWWKPLVKSCRVLESVTESSQSRPWKENGQRKGMGLEYLGAS